MAIERWWKTTILTMGVVSLLTLGSACDREGGKQTTGQPSNLVDASAGLPVGNLWRQDFTFADMDGDGELDLITAPPRKSKEPWPHIFLHRQNRWEPVLCDGVNLHGFPQEYGYGGLTVADFDADGKPEIALAIHEIGVRLLKNRGQDPCGPWEEETLPEEIKRFRSRAIVAADMNGDRRVDMVALNEAPPINSSDDTHGIAVLWNESEGWRLQTILGSEGLFGDDITVGEVNGDNIPDIAIGSLSDSRPQFLWLSDGKGGWQAASTTGLPEFIIAWSVQLVDFDNDGKDELVMGVGGAPVHKNGGPRVYRWDAGQWTNLSQGLPQVSWVCGVTATDLDRDGKKEIVAAGMYTGDVRVYGQLPDGTWGERVSLQIHAEEKMRNYKLRSFVPKGSHVPVVVANYASENTGRITAWVWQ